MADLPIGALPHGLQCRDCSAALTKPRTGRPPERCKPCTTMFNRIKSRDRARRLAANLTEAERLERNSRSRAYQIARARQAGVVPLSEARARRTEESRTAKSSVCKHCGASFVAKERNRTSYCSRECAFEGRREQNRAKAAERYPFSRVEFTACRCCAGLFAARRAAILYCSEACRLKAQETKRIEKGQAAFVPRIFRCVECDACCISEYGSPRSKFCSDDCSNRHMKRVSRKRERARMRTAHVEPVNPIKVFDLDGWRCQLCRCSTPRKLKGTTKPNAPELDHIVALAKGGEHSYRNTQLLCRACNSAKSDRDIGQQLRLFG